MIPLLATLTLLTPQTNPFEPEIAAFEAADKTNPPKPGGILFVGSSSIRLWTTLAQDFPAYNVINRGFGGSQIADSIHYAPRIVTPYKPKIIVFFAGTNDLAEGKSPQTVAADYQTFVKTVRTTLPDVKVVYIAITPAPSRWDNLPQVKEANTLIQTQIAQDKNQRFLNTAPLFITPEGNPRPELFVEDRLHLNPQGYKLWKTALTPVLQELTDNKETLIPDPKPL